MAFSDVTLIFTSLEITILAQWKSPETRFRKERSRLDGAQIDPVNNSGDSEIQLHTVAQWL